MREEDVVATPRRPPKIWPWLLALLVLVLAGLAAAYFLTRDDDEASEARAVTVPDVVGARVDEANRTLGARGLISQAVRASSERPAGEVIRQRPQEGATLDRGDRVTLVVSAGPRQVNVPDVVGLPLAAAFRRIEAAGLRPQARRVFSPRARGRVLKQQPAAETRLKPEQLVLLTISKGPGRVALPSLVGLSEAEAAAQLTAAGLRANVARVSSTEPTGTVVAQNPSPGTQVARRTAVRINVSKGPSATTPTTPTTTTTTTATTTATTPPGTTRATTTVPDVVGQDETSARTRLRQAGFAVRSVTRTTTDPAEDGIVLEQRPAAGASARSGAQVTIVVGLLG